MAEYRLHLITSENVIDYNWVWLPQVIDGFPILCSHGTINV